MVLDVAVFGWHATIFLGWWTLLAGLLLAAITIVLLKYFASAA
jgi:hypothetical protein